MKSKIAVAVWLFCFAALAPSTSQAQQKYVVGILPVYDMSAEELTEFLPNGLGMLLFKHMRDLPSVEPVMLSAGGLYDPGSADWNLEYGRRAHVDALVIARIYKSEKINDRKRKLKYSFQVMDTATGTTSPEVTNTEVELTTDSMVNWLHSAANSSSNTYISAASNGFWRSSEDFEKQPLGKAAAKLADWTIAQLPAALTAQSVKQTGTSATAPAPPATCPVKFKIRFVSKHSIAKGYTVFANDQDESSTVADGIATFQLPGGKVVFRVDIPDPPYGLPTQKLYQSSISFQCGADQHLLSFDIGPAGEALLHWEP